MLAWLSTVSVAVLASGIAIGTAATKLFTVAAKASRVNDLPSSNEPMVYLTPVSKRLPNGRVIEMTVRNTLSRDIWIQTITPVSRAFGRIHIIPREALSNDVKYVIEGTGMPDARVGCRLEPAQEIKILALISGKDWPIWHFSILIDWSPYGDAARPLRIKIHCKV